jgi:hypothetical protein
LINSRVRLTPAASSTLAASSFCACKGYCSRSSGRRKACCILQRHAPQAHPWGVCNPTVSRLSPPVLLSHASSLAGALAHGGFLHSRRRTGPRRSRRLFFDGGGRGSWAARPPPFPISLFMVPSLTHRGEPASRVLAGLELCPCAAGAEGLPPRAMAECGEVSFPFLPFARLRPASARPGSSPSLFSRAQPGGKRGRRDPPRASSARGPARPLGQLRLEASASPSWRRPPSPLLIHAR